MIGSSSLMTPPQMSAGGPLIQQLLAKLGVPGGAMPNVMTPGGGIGGGQGVPAPALGPGQALAAAPDSVPIVAAPEETMLPGPGPVAPMEAPAPQMQGRGFFGKVGDYLHQPGVAAALFRSGAATLQGGLGAGLEAGANYMDKRKSTEAAGAQQQFENAIASGRLDLDKLTAKQKDDLAHTGINVDIARLGETVRSNKTNERIAVRGQDVQKYGVDTNASVAKRGQDVSVQNNNTDNLTAQRGQDKAYAAKIYGTNAGIMTAGIGSRGGQGYSETTTIPGTPGGMFSAGTPDRVKTVTRTPMAPMGVPATATADGSSASIVAPPTAPLAPPKPGQVVGGKTFLGGDPRNPKSWR